MPGLLTNFHLCCSPTGWMVGSGSDKYNCSLRERETIRVCIEYSVQKSTTYYTITRIYCLYYISKTSIFLYIVGHLMVWYKWVIITLSSACIIATAVSFFIDWWYSRNSQIFPGHICTTIQLNHEVPQSFLNSVIKFLMNGKNNMSILRSGHTGQWRYYSSVSLLDGHDVVRTGFELI